MPAGGPVLLEAPKGSPGSVTGLPEHRSRLQGMYSASFPAKYIPGGGGGGGEVAALKLTLL